MQILIVGAGAIGSYIGGSLASAGEKVVFLERPEIAESQSQREVIIHHNGQVSTASISLTGSLIQAESNTSFDLVIIAVKSFDIQSVIEKINTEMVTVPPILCLQNGVENEGLLGSAFGQGNVIAGSVTTAIGKSANSEIIVEKLRGVGIASNHVLSKQLVAMMTRADLQAELVDSPDGMKWSKLLTNLIANASSAILDMTPAEIFMNKLIYSLEIAQLRETLAVMQASQIPVVDLPGVPVKLLALAAGTLPLWLSQPLLSKFVGKGRGNKMPSFYIDLLAGYEKSEVDYLNGAVVRSGRTAGIATPVNEFLTQTLLDIVEKRLDRSTYQRQPEKLVADFRLWQSKR